MKYNGRKIFIFVVLGLFASYILIHYGIIMLNGERAGEVARSSLAERGDILDRNGRVLARQVRLANVKVTRSRVINSEKLSAALAPIINMPAAEIYRIIAPSQPENTPNDVFVKMKVDDSTIRDINAALAEDNDKDLKDRVLRGVFLEPVAGRVYPERNLASHIIGYAGDDVNVRAGIESVWDSVLSGKDNNGKGSHVMLTIDANVQHILGRIAAHTMEETSAEAVMFLAMDPRTGDILGAASMPDFDPNRYGSSNSNALMDRLALYAYEPGSVFKIFSLAALMDRGVISGDTVFVCNGAYERVTARGETVRIRCLGVHGPVTVKDIIIHSCNAGAAYASDHMGSALFYDILRNGFGFGARTQVGNPAETVGLLRQPDDSWDWLRPAIAMGQGISVSALQMIQAATTIANDGILVPPRIVSRIISADRSAETIPEYQGSRRVLNPETARAMRSYMADVTSSIGTGWRAAVDDLSLAVKTGTAQIFDPALGGYSETDFIASCIALLPADSPSLVLYLAIIKPKGEILGGRIAAPAIREAAEALIDYLGIPRGRNPQINRSPSVTISSGSLPVIHDQIPDFTGIAKRTLSPLLLRDDINVIIQGDGWVFRQSPPPGTPVTQDMTLVLELR